MMELLIIGGLGVLLIAAVLFIEYRRGLKRIEYEVSENQIKPDARYKNMGEYDRAKMINAILERNQRKRS